MTNKKRKPAATNSGQTLTKLPVYKINQPTKSIRGELIYA
jgi:hypothetical protein